MKPKGSSRISYTARFKLTVVTYALEKGNREAARQFQVDEKNVRRWRSQQEKLKGLCRDQRAAQYCPAKFPELEKELKEWIDEKRKAGIGISTTVIRLKAKSMAKARNIAESEFKASVHWCHRFMDRHDLSIRRRTTISQKLPENFEDKLEKFQAFIIAEREKPKYELSLIGNADQTPLTFDMPSNSTVDSKGTKSVSLMTTGHEKDRFTVMLACLGDGTKLPPYVVFKRKTLPKDLVLPRGIHVRAQAKGWMNVLDGTEDDILWEDMDESDPFADNDGAESIVDEEGELFYAGEEEVSVLDVNEQEYRDIFGESDIDEGDFNGF